MIIVVIYLIAGYWAAGYVIYRNKIVFKKVGQLFVEKVVWGAILGWLLIPVAIVMKLLGK